ncbi:MAG: hypothetical protein ACC634_10260 [Hyphomicrobiales bacterium]
MNDPQDQTHSTQETGSTGAKLREAMRKARVAQTVRNDVIVDLRETELARLEVLADTLAPVFAELPDDAEQFECSLVAGSTPRLWIDMLAFIDMGRDKRTYRFVSDTRSGRQIMFETTNVADIADRVTNYIAHRLVERERSLAAGTPAQGLRPARRHGVESETVTITGAEKFGTPYAAIPPKSRRWSDAVQIGLPYVAGLLTGAAAIVLLALYVTN